jgi:uncharacterized membrane protein
VPEQPRNLGPVQLLVIAFEDGSFEGKILDELRRLRDDGTVRLLDLLFVAKDDHGEVLELEQSDLSVAEAAEFGALAGALIGFEGDGGAAAVSGAENGLATAAQNGSLLDPEAVWYLADVIPPKCAAAIVLIEHRWAIPLRDAIEAASGHDLIDGWIHPEDLQAAGAAGG